MPVLIFPVKKFAGALPLVLALLGNVAFATSFSVSQSIAVSGVTSGSGSGSGTATLDAAAGTLTLNLTTTTVTGFTDTTTNTVATIAGVFSADSLSGVSGSSQLINCTNNGGLVNGCGSVTSAFGTDFLADPITFDLSPLGMTMFSVRDTNSGATIEQSITLVTGGTPPLGPPATIDFTSGGATQYTFNPGDGSSVSLNIVASSGSVTQGSSGLGNHTGTLDDGALDNYWTGSTRETLSFTFSEAVVLDSIAFDLFEPIATSERAELSLNGGGVTTIDENNASRTGGDLSNWEYSVDEEVTSFSISTPNRGAIGNSTFRINSLIVSSVAPVDSDEDGLIDDVETGTGVFIDASDTGSDPNNPDSDADGVLDGIEIALGIDPNNADSDDDGVPDGAEVAAGTDPGVSQFPCDVDAVAGRSVGDLLLLQQHLLNSVVLSANEQIVCDLDFDGILSLLDFQLLQQQLLQQP